MSATTAFDAAATTSAPLLSIQIASDGKVKAVIEKTRVKEASGLLKAAVDTINQELKGKDNDLLEGVSALFSEDVVRATTPKSRAEAFAALALRAIAIKDRSEETACFTLDALRQLGEDPAAECDYEGFISGNNSRKLTSAKKLIEKDSSTFNRKKRAYEDICAIWGNNWLEEWRTFLTNDISTIELLQPIQRNLKHGSLMLVPFSMPAYSKGAIEKLRAQAKSAGNSSSEKEVYWAKVARKYVDRVTSKSTTRYHRRFTIDDLTVDSDARWTGDATDSRESSVEVEPTASTDSAMLEEDNCNCSLKFLSLVKASQNCSDGNNDFSSAVGDVVYALGAGLDQLCGQHVRYAADAVLGLDTRRADPRRIRQYVSRIHSFFRSKLDDEYYQPPEEMDEETLAHHYKSTLDEFRNMHRADFKVDFEPMHAKLVKPSLGLSRAKYLERFQELIGGNADFYLDDGITTVDFTPFMKLRPVKAIVQETFRLYKHYSPADSEGQWVRNMFYSLPQQLLRQDIGLWLLATYARANNNYRLVSYPSCGLRFDNSDTKWAAFYTPASRLAKSDAWDLYNSPRIRVVADVDTNMSCKTYAIPKLFGENYRRWYADKKDITIPSAFGNGRKCPVISDNVPLILDPSLYMASEMSLYGRGATFGSYVGDVRISLPWIPEGRDANAGKSKEFDMVYVAVSSNGELERSELGTWDEFAAASRSGVPPVWTPFELPALPNSRKVFPVTVMLEPTNPISEALVGSAPWSRPDVQLAVKEVFSLSDDELYNFLVEHRRKSLESFFEAWVKLVELEKAYASASHRAYEIARVRDPQITPPVSSFFEEHPTEVPEALSLDKTPTRRLASELSTPTKGFGRKRKAEWRKPPAKRSKGQ